MPHTCCLLFAYGSVPHSRIVLKNKPFACEAFRAHFMAVMTSHGVETWRVDLLPLAAANADHLATYALMDISLDPFPYAGEWCGGPWHHSTAVQGLWGC